jgi:hypothetical protein
MLSGSLGSEAANLRRYLSRRETGDKSLCMIKVKASATEDAED